MWMQRLAFFLFYGVMALVAVTCGLEIVHMVPWPDAVWMGVLGSWIGGLGSFAAALVAVIIAMSQRYTQSKKSEISRKAVAFQLDKISTRIVMHLMITQDIQWRNMIKSEFFRLNLEQVSMFLSFRFNIVPMSIIEELPYLHEIQNDIQLMYSMIENYTTMLSSAISSDDKDYDRLIDTALLFGDGLFKVALKVSRYAKTILGQPINPTYDNVYKSEHH